jgi:hypothetical protein
VLNGFDTDLAANQTRVTNRLRDALTSISPVLERVLGNRLHQAGLRPGRGVPDGAARRRPGHDPGHDRPALAAAGVHGLRDGREGPGRADTEVFRGLGDRCGALAGELDGAVPELRRGAGM